MSPSNSSRVQFTLVDNGEQQFITVYVPGRDPRTCDDSHPEFDAILDGALAGEDVSDLFDVAPRVSEKFARLSERVTVEGGHVFFDGDLQHGSVVEQIITAIDEGREDWQYLVAFMEKVAANPNQHSREQLFDWLSQEGLRLTDEGDIIGYKALTADGEGRLCSIHSGPAVVNGEKVSGRVPNPVGAIVEMPRLSVAHDPSAACSSGLHVATQDYAESFGGDSATIVEVHVNPRDVVSVPTDGGGEKVRVCRYRVARVVRYPRRFRSSYDW